MKVSHKLGLILLVLISFVLMQACATAPKLPEPKPGLYVNEEYRFSVEYPEDWPADALQGVGEVMRVHHPNNWKLPVLTATIGDRDDDATLNSEGLFSSSINSFSSSIFWIPQMGTTFSN